MVGHARAARVDVGAAELLGRHLLAGRRLHERRAADEDRPGAADDDRLVRHRRHVGAAGGARAHHDRDLRDALRGHARLVVEDPAEVLAVGEDLVLEREEGPARVDEVEARQVVLLGDLLRAEVLLHREREVRAALHRRVVRDDHAGATLDDPDPRDDARRRRLAVVDVPGGERVQLEERRARVDEPVDPLPRGQLAAGAVPLERPSRRRPPRRAPFARGARATSACIRASRRSNASSRDDVRREDRHPVSSVTRTRAGRHLVADGHVDRADRRVVRGGHDLLHLHRLEDDERLVRLDLRRRRSTLTSITLPGIGAVTRPSPPRAAAPAAGGRLDLERREPAARGQVEPPGRPSHGPGGACRGRCGERRVARRGSRSKVAARGRPDGRRASGGTAGSSSRPRRRSPRARRASRSSASSRSAPCAISLAIIGS